MPKNRFTDEQIVFLRSGRPTQEPLSAKFAARWACRRPRSTAGSRSAPDWVASLVPPLVRATTASELRRLKQLENEDGKLRRLVADLSLAKEMLTEVIRKKLQPRHGLAR